MLGRVLHLWYMVWTGSTCLHGEEIWFRVSINYIISLVGYLACGGDIIGTCMWPMTSPIRNGGELLPFSLVHIIITKGISTTCHAINITCSICVTFLFVFEVYYFECAFCCTLYVCSVGLLEMQWRELVSSSCPSRKVMGAGERTSVWVHVMFSWVNCRSKESLINFLGPPKRAISLLGSGYTQYSQSMYS